MFTINIDQVGGDLVPDGVENKAEIAGIVARELRLRRWCGGGWS